MSFLVWLCVLLLSIYITCDTEESSLDAEDVAASDLLSNRSYNDSAMPKIYEDTNKDDTMEITDANKMVTIDIGRNIRVVEGVSVTIRCSATGKPQPAISWELNRQPIKDDLILQTPNSLVIIKFQKYHSGYYTCNAENDYGRTTAYSNIHENEAPPIILSSEKNFMVTSYNESITEITIGDRLSAINGSKFVIKCPFVGFPYPRAVWFLNGVIIDHELDNNIDISESDGVSLLTVRSLNKAYARKYTCTVFNIYGRKPEVAMVRLIRPEQPTIFSKRHVEKYDSSEEFVNASIGTNITVFEGTTISIYCDARSSSNRTNFPIKWSSDVTTNKHRKGVIKGNSLQIIDIAPEDAGVYTCTINGSRETGDVSATKINVIEKIPPSIEVSNRSVRYVKGWDTALLVIGENLLVRAGLDVKILCRFKAFPVGELSWQRNGVTLSLPDRNMDVSGKSLMIKGIKETSGDIYTCVVKSVIGTATASSMIKVIPKRSKPPKITKSRVRIKKVLNSDSMVTADVGTSLKIVEGASVTINCPADGKPKPTIKWFVGGKPIDDKYIVQAGDALVFLKFQKHNAGYYKCAAENVVGKSRAFSDVRLQAPTELAIMKSEGSFQITERNRSAQITIGEKIKTTGGRNITIFCPTEGTPKPKVLWKYKDDMLRDGERIKVDEHNSLFMLDVKPWDSGVYTCYAGNGLSVVSASSSLQILPEGSPIIIASRKEKKVVAGNNLVDIEIGTNITTIPGKSLRILCPAIGGGNLFYDWTIDGKPLDYDTRMSLQIRNQLIIRELQFFDMGLYKCRVYNQFGSDSMSTLLVLIDDGTVIGGVKKKTDQTTGRVLQRYIIGDDITASKGSSFEIICPTRGGKRPQLAWFRENTPIAPSNHIVPRGEVLLLQYVLPNMAGYYTCQLVTEFGIKRATSYVKINDIIPGQILSRKGLFEAFNPDKHLRVVIGQDVYAVSGVAITIECPSKASPPGVTTWLLNSTKIIESKNFFFGGKNNALIIPKMSPRYIGRYSCSLKQGKTVRSAYSKIFLISMEKPVIKCSSGKIFTNPSSSHIVHVPVGNDIMANLFKNVFIHCPYSAGTPKGKIVWKLNGNSIERVSGIHDLKNGTLEFQSVAWEHQGSYECYQINPIGVDTCSSEVKVIGENCPTDFKVTPRKVQVRGTKKETAKVIIGSDVMAKEGSSILLQCPVSTHGRCDVIWKKDGRSVTKKSWKKHDDLLIEKLQVDDSGDYTCYSAEKTKVKFGTVVLKVIVSLQNLLRQPPQADEYEEDTESNILEGEEIPVDVGNDIAVYVGSTIKFTCRLKKESDNFDITWLKNNRKISDDEFYTMNMNVLDVRDTVSADRFNITCMVSGLLDSAKISSTVIVKAKTRAKIQFQKGSVSAINPSKPLSTVIGKTISSISGITIRIRCPYIGPKVKLAWFVNYQKIINNPMYAFEGSGNALIISKMSPYYVGNYTCQTLDGEEVTSSSSTLLKYLKMQKPKIRRSFRTVYSSHVTSKPVVMTIGDTLTTNLYKQILIRCSADGLPIPNVEWKFNGKELTSIENVQQLRDGTLKIDSVLWKHQGLFQCIRTNPAGIDYEDSKVNVVGKNYPANYTSRRNITTFRKSRRMVSEASIGSGIIVKESSDIILKCSVGKLGSIYVKWEKIGGGFERTGQTADGRVKLTNLKTADTGTYVCSSGDRAKIQFGRIKVRVLESVKRSVIKSKQKPIEYTIGPYKEVEANIGTNVRILSGNKLKFLCAPKPGIDANVTWLIDGRNIPQTPKYSVLQRNTLLINDTWRAGTFKVSCVVTGLLESASFNSRVHVVGILPVTINSMRGTRTATGSSKTLIATIGERIKAVNGITIKILCPHTAPDQAKLHWLMNSMPINMNPKFVLEKDTNALIIPKISRKYVGKYTCHIKGEISSAKATSQVVLQAMEKPKLIKSSKVFYTRPTSNRVTSMRAGDSVVTNFGKRVLIHCRPTGVPLANVVWKFKGKKMVVTLDGEAASKLDNTIVHKNGSLDIGSVSWKHRGKYECYQTNEVGLDFATSFVKVYGLFAPTNYQAGNKKFQILESRRKTVTVPIGSEVIIARGNSLLLQCPVHVYGKVKVKWTKDRVPYEGNKDGNVFLPLLSRSDSGKYKCHADDPSEVIFGSVDLLVIVPPKDIIAKPKTKHLNFTKATSQDVSLDIGTNLKVLRGNTVKFRCPLIFDTDVTISWFMNNRMLTAGKLYDIQRGILIMKTLPKAKASYISCVAKAPLGTAKRTTRMDVISLRSPRIIKSNKVIHTNPKKREKVVFLNIGDSIIANLLKTVMIHCPASGIPEPKVVWKFNGKSLVSNNDFTKMKNGSLLIAAVKWRNKGVIECYRINKAGLDAASTSIKVYGRNTPTNYTAPKRLLNFMDFSGRLALAPIGSTVTISESKTIAIECNVNNVPIFWTKDGTLLPRTRLSARKNVLLERLRVNDAGIYECFSKDEAKVKLGAIDLKVIVPLEKLIIRPSIKYMEYLKTSRVRINADAGTTIKLLTKNTIRFICRLRSMKDIQVNWLRDNKAITGRPGYFPKSNTLIVSDTSSAESFTITCIVSRPKIQKSTSKISSAVKIIESKAVEIRSKLGTLRTSDPNKNLRAVIGNTIYAVAGVPIEINCPTVAVPPANVTWYFNNNEVKPSSEYMIGKINDALFIPKMSKNNAGRYKCEAKQGKLKVAATSRVYLTDMQKPVISKSSRSHITIPTFQKANHITAGDSITANLYQHIMINCPALGVPKPKVFWKFNGKLITKSKNVIVLRNSTLFIRNILWKNGGVYQCHAANPMGLDTAESKVTVIGRFSPSDLKLKHEKLMVLNTTKITTSVNIGSSLTIRAGNSLILKCPVTMYGAVPVQWEKDGKIFQGTRFPRGTVVLPKLKAEDTGEYACYSNDQSKMKFGVVKVKVVEHVNDILSRIKKQKARREGSKQRQALIGKDITVFTGNTFKLICPVKSNENIKVSWLRNGRKVRSNDRYLIDDNVMIILDTSRKTEYRITCVMEGILGSAKITSRMRVVEYQPAEIKRSSKVLKETSPLKNIRAIIGDTILAIPGITVEIQCPHTGLPRPQVSWFINGTEVNDMFKYPLGKIGYTLVIPKMTNNHVGKYTCQLNQKVSVKMAHSVVKLMPLIKPKIVFSKRAWFTSPKVNRGKTVIKVGDSIIANLRKRVEITCQSTGVPDPTIEWKINGNPITDVRGLTVSRNGNLEVTVDWKHNGIFECNSVNVIGTDTAYTKMTVYGEDTPTKYKAPIRNRRLLTLQSRPSTVSIGTNITARAYNSLRLTCPVSRVNVIRYFWMKDGIRLRQKGKKGQSLLLQRVHKKDSGKYTCVSDDPAKVKFGSVNIEVLQPLGDLFIKPTSSKKKNAMKELTLTGNMQSANVGTDVKALSGRSIKLRCMLKSTDNVRITWLKNGRPLKRSSKDIVQGDTLIIKETAKGGNFTYTCSLSGLLGKATQTSNIEIIEYVPAKILSKRGSVNLSEPLETAEIIIGKTVAAVPGVSITLKCPTDGVPKPTITWYFNTSKLENVRSHVVIAKMSSKYIGKYTCFATQGSRNSTAVTNINILAMSIPKIRHSNSTVLSKPNDRTTVHVNIGDSLIINLYKRLMIHCSASGIPKPNPVWLFNGKPISLVQNVLKKKNGSLVITSVLWTHDGLFECFQMNVIGMDRAASDVKVYGRYTPTKYIPTKRTIRVLMQKNMPITVAIGSTIFVQSSNSLSLKCPVQHHGPVGIAWYKDGKLIKYGRQYKLQELDTKDSGDYACRSNDHANIKFGTITVIVLDPVKDLVIAPVTKRSDFLQYSSQEHEVTVGTNVTMIKRNKIAFACLLKSKDNVNITWLVNGEAKFNSRKYVVEGDILRVKSTIRESEDNITCHVATLLGNASLTSRLQIVAPSRLRMRKIKQKLTLLKLQEEFNVGGSVKIRHGSSIRMNCPASGVPPPDIQWMYNDMRIDKDNELQVNIIEENKVLFIPLVEKRHTGLYKCIASGTNGGVNVATVSVNVYEPMGPEIKAQYKATNDPEILGPDDISSPPSSSSSLLIVRRVDNVLTREAGRDYKLLSGLKLNLTCPARGQPKPSVNWERNGTVVARNVNYILINTKRANSSGLYSCTARNAFGRATKTSNVTIIVPTKPVIQRKSASTNKAEYVGRKVEVVIGEDLEALSGTKVTIRCPVIGIPRPKITYHKNRKLLKYSDQISLDPDTGTLELSPATTKNSGVYTCRAENEAGYTRSSTKLDVYNAAKPRLLSPKTGVDFMYSPNITKGNLTISVGQSAIGYPNTQAVFKCPVSGFPFPDITWLKDTRILAEIKGKKDTSLFHLLRDQNDAGEYSCTATNMAGRATGKVVISMKTPLSAHIVIKDLSTILSSSMSEAITIGQHANLIIQSSVTIHCPSKGEPTPRQRWSVSKKPRGWLEKQKNVNISTSGDKISIRQMTKEFSGIYSCYVVNLFGSDERFSNLLVKDPSPVKISGSRKRKIADVDVSELAALIGEELYVRPGTRVLIQCPVSGMPYPTVTWMKNKKMITSNIDGETNTLKLPRVTVKDAGTYTCIARNIISTSKNFSKLYVGTSPQITNVPNHLSPMLSLAPYAEVIIPVGVKEAFVRSGSSVSFQCKGRGHPPPSIVWFRNGVGIDYKKGDKKYQSLIPSVLEVRKLSQEDSGVYSCLVKNAFGKVVKRTKLEILEPPVIQTSKSNITFITDYNVRITVGGGIIVLRGANVTISCPATGRPKPSIRWFEPKGKTMFGEGRRFVVNANKQLIIKNIQTYDSGKYICTATNKVANTSSFMRLLVADAPSAKILPNYGGQNEGKDLAVLDDEGNLIVSGGSAVRLFCRAFGSPPPRVTWLKDNMKIRPSKKYSVDKKGLLLVRDAEKADAGTYVCMVDNPLSLTAVALKVIIGASPNVLKKEIVRRANNDGLVEASVGTDVNVYKRSTVKMYCNATGLPKPEMTWVIRFTDYELKKEVISSQSAESGVLTLSNITEGANGSITCIATNVIGTDNVTSRIHVLGPPQIIPDVNSKYLTKERFMLIGRDKELDILEGESINLICVGTGSPYPNFTFSHERHKLSDEELFRVLQDPGAKTGIAVADMMSAKTRIIRQNKQFMDINRGGQKVIIASVTIRKITLLDKDIYSCKANSSAGTDERKIRLIVHPKPKEPYTGTWVYSGFSECSTPCDRRDYGTRTRNVTCLTYGGKITDAAWCGVNWKPKTTVSCPTMECATEWRAGMWSKCSATCGTTGVQKRTLHCVYVKWKTRIIDHKECSHLQKKPRRTRTCNQYPCTKDLCMDKQSYCKYLKILGLCIQQRYKTLCCASCVKRDSMSS